MKLNTTNKVLIGLGVLVLLLAFWLGGNYNSLVSTDENVNKAWGNVQAQYQRRFDLIPNLAETVKGYATHEQELFTKVAELRSQWSAKPSVDTAQQLDSTISRLLLVAENYPQLKASESFLNLQAQLEGTENRVSVARQDYNTAVQGYNVQVRRFPTNIVASVFGFNVKESFKAEAGTEKAPKVDF
ncbi:LemA family protein [Candidatus Woesearchaeota archaeon]|nr:LemA family protein [Candidatus Woesearchaeota archaeon]